MVEKKSENLTLSNSPETVWFWKGLGGNFDTITQILNEFIDNSMSDFIKNNQSEIKKLSLELKNFQKKSTR